MDHVNLRDMTDLIQDINDKLLAQNEREIKFYFKSSIYEGNVNQDKQDESRTLGTLMQRMAAIKSTLPQEEIEQIVQAEDNSDSSQQSMSPVDQGSYPKLMYAVK